MAARQTRCPGCGGRGICVHVPVDKNQVIQIDQAKAIKCMVCRGHKSVSFKRLRQLMQSGKMGYLNVNTAKIKTGDYEISIKDADRIIEETNQLVDEVKQFVSGGTGAEALGETGGLAAEPAADAKPATDAKPKRSRKKTTAEA